MAELPSIGWLDARQNPWNVPVLDVRPVTLKMLSTSKDPQCAENVGSLRGDDGTSFAGLSPRSARSVSTALRYPIDRYLADGVLFSPEAMEHKWAIFLHRGRIIFVRSWLRQVLATAEVEVADGFAKVVRIHGALATEDEDPVFSVRAADYLIRTHALNMRFPAPLPNELADAQNDRKRAAMWCMSSFGSMAEFATPHPIDLPPPSKPLRTDSLLHIAVARGDRSATLAQLDAGVPVALLAKKGLSPLHWATAYDNLVIGDLLLERGSPVDVRSAEMATPLMNAVQAKSQRWVDFLLSRGADPNARDHRGFTALHRAAEMGHVDVVRRLLDAGAQVEVKAEEFTPLSLARLRSHAEIINLLTQRAR